MSRPNTSFEISVDEMEIIESALRAAIPANDDPAAATENDADKAQTIAELLGRLHNQKNFFRPARQTYISG